MSGREHVDLFQAGEFTLASGERSTFKIECDALSEAEWQCLAKMLAAVVPPFGQVVGVPRGGLPLAAALRPYCTEGSLLVVDDVWTTGGSMRRFVDEHTPHNWSVNGAVVFARGAVEPWVTPLWTLHTTAAAVVPDDAAQPGADATEGDGHG